MMTPQNLRVLRSSVAKGGQQDYSGRRRFLSTIDSHLEALNPVWVAQVGVLDSECYSEGTETTITLHRSRDSAIGSVADVIWKAGVGRYPGGAPTGDDAVQLIAVADFSREEGPFWRGEYVEDDRFEWSWLVYQRAVRP